MLNQSEPNLILTAHATKLNRPEPNWTEPQTCLAGRNHAFKSNNWKQDDFCNNTFLECDVQQQGRHIEHVMLKLWDVTVTLDNNWDNKHVVFCCLFLIMCYSFLVFGPPCSCMSATIGSVCFYVCFCIFLPRFRIFAIVCVSYDGG